MKVIHLMTTPDGGAARVGLNLNTGLRGCGVDSRVLLAKGDARMDGVSCFVPPRDIFSMARRWVTSAIQRAQFRPYRQWQRTSARPRWERFSAARGGWGKSLARAVADCDIVHLHWVSDFVDLGSFFDALPERARVVWTLHDLWPFTGGCHFPEGCEKFRQSCGSCPQWGSKQLDDFSRKNWEIRRRAFVRWGQGKLRLAASSQWIADCARDSSIFQGVPIDVIENGIDLEGFVPIDRAAARQQLNLPQDAFVALFLADSGGNRRKGLTVLEAALKGIKSSSSRVLLVAGDAVARALAGWTVVPLGYVTQTARLSEVYSAADVFVHSALEDNFPNTVIEAMACGTPVAAFRVGGLPEIVTSEECGSLCEPATADALRAMLVPAERWASSPERRAACRTRAENFSIRRMVESYRAVYRTMLGAY